MKMITVERMTDDNFSRERRESSISRDESLSRATRRDDDNDGRRNRRGSEAEERNRKPAVSARANYDPTWRVKGNPICITRRTGYRHEAAISPLHV